jgi:hypothetical protein
MGKGIAVYSSLSREGNYAIAWFLAIAAVFWLACLWIVDAFDPSITDVSARRAVKALTAIPLAMLFVASMLAVEEYVSAPMVLFVVFKALLDKTLFDLVCPAGAASAFMVAVGYGNVAVSVAVILGWCVWMWAFDKEWSNREMFDLYHERLDCDRTSDTLEVGRCQAAYLIWGAPLIVGLLCFFFGLACLYLAKEGSAVRMLMIQFLILGMGMWVSMSISGAEMGLADDLLQFALLFCSMMIVVCVNMIGYDNIKTKIGSMRMASKIGEYSQSNFAKAMLIVLTMPLIPLFMLLSAAIRQVAAARPLDGAAEGEAGRGGGLVPDVRGPRDAPLALLGRHRGHDLGGVHRHVLLHLRRRRREGRDALPGVDDLGHEGALPRGGPGLVRRARA